MRLILFSIFKKSLAAEKDFFAPARIQVGSFMSKSKKTNRNNSARRVDEPARRKPVVWIAALAAFLAIGTIVPFVVKKNNGDTQPTRNATAPPAAGTTPAPVAQPSQPASTPPNEPGKEPQMLTMDVNKAVMVTEELDFGGRVPSIAEALLQIERHYKPDDGQGRTFA